MNPPAFTPPPPFPPYPPCTPPEPPRPYEQKPPTGLGCIHLHYPGYWILFDMKITLYVNGYEYSKFSFKNPFDTDIEVPGGADITVKCLFRKKTRYIFAGTGYKLVTLIYDRFLGTFDLVEREN